MPFSVAPQRRPPAQPLRRHQEGQRADGAHLRAPLSAAGDGPALLHGLRAVGPAGHGAVPVHQGDPRRASRSRSSTTASMRRDFTYIDDIVEGVVRTLDRVAAPDPDWSSDRPDPATSAGALPPLQHRQQPAGRADALHRLHRDGARQDGREDTSCRCSPATCPPPTPTSMPWSPTSASSPRRRSRTASAASSTGTGSITGERMSTRSWPRRCPGSGPRPACAPDAFGVQAVSASNERHQPARRNGMGEHRLYQFGIWGEPVLSHRLAPGCFRRRPGLPVRVAAFPERGRQRRHLSRRCRDDPGQGCISRAAVTTQQSHQGALPRGPGRAYGPAHLRQPSRPQISQSAHDRPVPRPEHELHNRSAVFTRLYSIIIVKSQRISRPHRIHLLPLPESSRHRRG